MHWAEAGTQPGSKLRLRGKGMPEYKNTGVTGDLIVTLMAVFPTLNEKQKDLLKKMKEEGIENNY